MKAFLINYIIILINSAKNQKAFSGKRIKQGCHNFVAALFLD